MKIDDYFRFLAPAIWKPDKNGEISPPSWPADMFGMVASLLHRSGAYTGIGCRFWTLEDGQEWGSRAVKLARKWRRKCARGKQPPKTVRELWQLVVAHRDKEIGWLRSTADFAGASHDDASEACSALLKLLAVCDEAYPGVGLYPTGKRKPKELAFWAEAEESLLSSSRTGVRDGSGDSEHENLGSNLCRDLDTSRVRVLPKAQTLRLGLSLRSLTHHLALCPPVELPARWVTQAATTPFISERHCNLLLIPWPFHVVPSDFQGTEKVAHGNGHVGWFSYTPRDQGVGELLRAVERLLEQAKQSVGDIHAIVFPETALTDQQFADVAHMLRNRNISLISGVTREIEAKVSETTASKSDQSVNEPNEAEAKSSLRGRPVFQNYAAVHLPQMFSEPFTFEQGKHHRWKLDHDQIVRYGLSSALNPETDWWENIQVVDRSLHFFAIREWLCTCVLICEDLARLDPVGQFVRAVAPDLVIALLFDGPQLSNRWPAYHATVLADDPGASVLTLTSLGMAKLSRPTNHHGPDHATVIGMWRDASGNFVEIRLPPNSHAAVLTLHHRSRTSVTADGRANPHELGSPVFGGLNYLRIT